MRDVDVIRKHLELLRARQAELETFLREYIRDQNNQRIVEQPDRLWRAAEVVNRWNDEADKLDHKIKVLRWVLGEFEVFPLW